MKKLLTISTCLFAAFSLTGQNVQRLSATKANDYGLVYTLPATALDVTVEAEITVSEPGEFYRYAKKYLNIDNPITKTEKHIGLRSVVLSTHGVANPDQRFLITLKGGQNPFIILDEENNLLAINTEKTAPGHRPELPVSKPATTSILKSDVARQVVTEDMLMSHSTAKRAELAAAQIYEIRQTRSDLLTGQADQMPPDGQALKMIMDNLDARENALMAMFVGAETKQVVVKTVTMVPDGDIAGKIICRLSAVKGIVEPDDLSGAPVALSLEVINQGELPVNDKGEPLPFPKGGVAYCIPGAANVSVSFDGKTIEQKRFDFAQFGVVYGMSPSNFTDKKAPVYLILDPATGAALEVGAAN